MSDSSSSEDDSEKIRVSLNLAASCPHRDLEVSNEPVAVPVDITRKGLSAVLNHLLNRRVGDNNLDDEEEDKLPAISFDFLVGQSRTPSDAEPNQTDENDNDNKPSRKGGAKLLRTTVAREARRQGWNFEQAIPITYFPAQPSPETAGASPPLPDWVGALSLLSSLNVCCAGLYDGSLQLLDGTTLETVASTSTAHTGAIKCLASTTTTTNTTYLASGSMDQSLVVHTYDAARSPQRRLARVGQCRGHEAAVSCLAFGYGDTALLASGDWKGSLLLWDLLQQSQDGADDEQQANKKTKTSASSSSSSSQQQQDWTTPQWALRAHSSQISGLAFTVDNREIITASWDHSIKVWDVDRQESALQLNSSRVVSCMDASKITNVVATGHPDCTVRLWDVRTKAANTNTAGTTNQQTSDPAWSVADNTFRPSHKAWVSAIRWYDAYQLVTTSHDGMIKWWDIRSSLPLHTLKAFSQKEGQKALALAVSPTTLYAGGSDHEVKRLLLPTSLGGADGEQKQLKQ